MNAGVAAAGFFVGICVGLSGVGGSSLVTPFLILVLGFKPTLAVGTDLLYSVPTKLLGFIVHQRQGTTDRRTVLLLSCGGVPGAIAGVTLASYCRRALPVSTIETVLRHGIGIALLLSALLMLASFFRLELPRKTALPAIPHPSVLIAIGFSVGLIVTLTSIGSGSLTLPLLLIVVPGVVLRKLIGSDIAFAAIFIPISAFGQWRLGNVDVPIALSLLAGSLPGVLLGSILCKRLQGDFLKPAVAGILLFAGSRLV